jgi:antitoxin ParD1/3/4
MATMTISLPDPMKQWIEEQVKRGDYASTSDYMRDAVRRDRDRRDPSYQYTLEDLQQMLEDSANSGISEKTTKEIFEEARQLVAARRARFGL